MLFLISTAFFLSLTVSVSNGILRQFTALKGRSANLKTLIAVGGPSEASRYPHKLEEQRMMWNADLIHHVTYDFYRMMYGVTAIPGVVLGPPNVISVTEKCDLNNSALQYPNVTINGTTFPPWIERPYDPPIANPIPYPGIPDRGPVIPIPSPAKYYDKKIVCYFGSWSVYRNGNGKFDVEDIDPFLCTHLIYAFVGINSDGSIRFMDSWNEIDKGAIRRFCKLKERNPCLKIIFAIGGWNEGSTVFSQVANSPTLRAIFIKSAINLMQVYGFDGFDIDWEYPAQRGGGAYDVTNFVTLLREFRAQFDKYGYLLTAAVAAAGVSVDQSYDVPQVVELLDFVNLMTYDLHGAWDGATGHNAPLYPSSNDITELQRLLNVHASVRGWILRGADPAKLILGIGLYGRTFTLADSSNTGIGAAAYNGGEAGQYTRESGFLGYNEIVERLDQGGWTIVWDDAQRVPYAYKGNQWIGYDNPDSIAFKVQYALANGLGGAMVWSLETDDFRGLSGKRNPLLTAIKDALGLPSVVLPDRVTSASVSGSGCGESEPGSGGSESGSSSTTTTTIAGPTQAPVISDGSIVCGDPGLIRDSDDCSKFYNCVYSGAVIPATKCEAGLLFDETLKVCHWASQVSCP